VPGKLPSVISIEVVDSTTSVSDLASQGSNRFAFRKDRSSQSHSGIVNTTGPFWDLCQAKASMST